MSLHRFLPNGEIEAHISESLAENFGLIQVDLNEFIFKFVQPIVKDNIKLKSELEKYKKAYELETYERQKFIDDLETWKKIAEKLASKLNEAYFEQNDFWLFFEKEILKGIEADYGYVGDVIIDWARKEVEEDE